MFAIILPIIDPIAFHFPLHFLSFGLLRDFSITWYSISYIIAMYAVLLGAKITNRHKKIIKYTDIFDISVLYVVIGIVIGGRLFFTMIYDPLYYIKYPTEIIKIWNGGMSFHGGLIGAIISVLYVCNKYKVNCLQYGDLAVPFLPIGLMFGRFANFINAELYGRITNMPIGMIFPTDPSGIPRHPSQLYEAFLEGPFLFTIMIFLLYRTNIIRYNGYIFSIFLILYSVIRFCVEFVREPDHWIGLFFNILTLGQILSILTLLSGLILLMMPRYRSKNDMIY